MCVEYAPVFIPTLCRYNHFKNCIESLSNCTGADKTEVYISLDYPVNVNHREGYEKIKQYIDNTINNLHFKKVVILEKKLNYGVGIYGNFSDCLTEIFEKFDRIIISEDDNIFSSNFLEYINKGLELYKNDPRILAVCGYRNNFVGKFEDNNHFAQHSLFQAWGYGIWKNRYVRLQNELNPQFFERILLRDKMWKKCLYYWPTHFNSILDYAASTKTREWMCDVTLGFYMVVNNLCVINPTISKVRNCGFDGEATTTSLDHARMAERATFEKNLVIDKEDSFDFIGNPYVFEDYNSRCCAQWDCLWEEQRRFRYLKSLAHVWIYRIQHFLGYY